MSNAINDVFERFDQIFKINHLYSHLDLESLLSFLQVSKVSDSNKITIYRMITHNIFLKINHLNTYKYNSLCNITQAVRLKIDIISYCCDISHTEDSLKYIRAFIKRNPNFNKNKQLIKQLSRFPSY